MVSIRDVVMASILGSTPAIVYGQSAPANAPARTGGTGSVTAPTLGAGTAPAAQTVITDANICATIENCNLDDKIDLRIEEYMDARRSRVRSVTGPTLSQRMRGVEYFLNLDSHGVPIETDAHTNRLYGYVVDLTGRMSFAIADDEGRARIEQIAASLKGLENGFVLKSEFGNFQMKMYDRFGEVDSALEIQDTRITDLEKRRGSYTLAPGLKLVRDATKGEGNYVAALRARAERVCDAYEDGIIAVDGTPAVPASSGVEARDAVPSLDEKVNKLRAKFDELRTTVPAVDVQVLRNFELAVFDYMARVDEYKNSVNRLKESCNANNDYVRDVRKEMTRRMHKNIFDQDAAGIGLFGLTFVPFGNNTATDDILNAIGATLSVKPLLGHVDNEFVGNVATTLRGAYILPRDNRRLEVINFAPETGEGWSSHTTHQVETSVTPQALIDAKLSIPFYLSKNSMFAATLYGSAGAMLSKEITTTRPSTTLSVMGVGDRTEVGSDRSVTDNVMNGVLGAGLGINFNQYVDLNVGYQRMMRCNGFAAGFEFKYPF